MRKIKKIWKVLARSISWNFKTSENHSEIMNADKREQRKVPAAKT